MLDVIDISMDIYLEREWGNKLSDCVFYKDEEFYDFLVFCISLFLSCF